MARQCVNLLAILFFATLCTVAMGNDNTTGSSSHCTIVFTPTTVGKTTIITQRYVCSSSVLTGPSRGAWMATFLAAAAAVVGGWPL